jgi:hypothetical protein
MGSPRNALVLSTTALTIVAGASGASGTARAHTRGRGFHGAFASSVFGRGGLYVGHYESSGAGPGNDWSLGRALVTAGYYETCHYIPYGWSGDRGAFPDGIIPSIPMALGDSANRKMRFTPFRRGIDCLFVLVSFTVEA